MGNFGATEFLLIFLILGVLLIPGVFFLFTLQKALARCSPESRTMEPGEVWLLLIPLFNIVWQFIVVSRIASSLGNEFRKRNLIKEPEPGKSLGTAFCILNVCGIIPIFGVIAAIAGFVCWILYWVKISNYSGELAFPFSGLSYDRVIRQQKPATDTDSSDYKTIIYRSEPETLRFMGKLMFTAGEDEGKFLVLTGYPTAEGNIVTMGRDSVTGDRQGAHIKIDNRFKTVSHKQAEFIYKDVKLFVKDVAKTNHTQVDGVELSQEQMVELKPNSLIRTGELEFKYIVP